MIDSVSHRSPLKKQNPGPHWFGKRVGIVTLGCARNTVDSEKVLADARRQGAVVCAPQKASTVILNTCGFTEEAKAESLKTLSELIALKKAGKIREIFVRGCLSERYQEILRDHYPDVDQFSGLADFKDFFDPLARLTLKYTAYIKIAEGCANHCSFCAIPLIKGALRSRPAGAIVREARFLEDQGVRELNIIGQDITLYGSQGTGRAKGPLPLLWLLKDILKNTKIPWVRILYLHPRRVTDDLIDFMVSEKRMCPAIDLPLQHVSDRILRLMNRGITQKEIFFLIEKMRKKIPDVALRTSLIAGFPSETKKEFRELCAFIERVKFDRLGVFAYSREEGTRAYHFAKQVTSKIKSERRGILMSLQARISRQKLHGRIGRFEEVLVERATKKPFAYMGRTRRDAPEVDGIFLLSSRKRRCPGELVTCRVTGATVHDLRGEVVE